jgi:predicted permease
MIWTRWFRLRSNDDFAAEVESHVAMETERLMRAGLSEEAARHAARRAFGNTTVSRERFREARTGASFESFMQDVRYGLRAMRRSPGFTLIAVASFAIGIGANTTMFGAVDTLLFRAPAHVVDADRIHRIYFQTPDQSGLGIAFPTTGYRTYVAIRDFAQGLESVGAVWARRVSSGRGEDARSLEGAAVTPNVFPMLGVRPALGRFFLETEARDDGEHVAVISYETWQSQFSGGRDALGKTIDVSGEPYTIVGVAPRGFTGVDMQRVDLWLPLGVARRLLDPGVMEPTRGGYWLDVIVKRRANVSAEQSAFEVTRAYRDAWKDDRRYEERYAKAQALLGSLVSSRGPGGNDASRIALAKVSLWVAVVSLLVLLIAAANVANLLLLRGLTRSREVALRLSLGATRGRIVRQWLVEGALLAAFGAACAIVLARWTAAAIHTFLIPQTEGRSIVEPRFLVFTSAIAIGAGLLASLVPALITARRNFAPLLGTGRPERGPRRVAIQRGLIGGQVALAMLLLVGAGLFVTSLRNVRAINLGIDAEHLLYVKLDAGSFRKLNTDPGVRSDNDAAYVRMLENVRRAPGVVAAAVTAGEPLTSGWGITLRRRIGDEIAPGMPVPMGRAVGLDYFKTMQTRLLRGRVFTAADHTPTARVAIIDEATAKRYFPDGNGLASCVHVDGSAECTEIVGVVENTVLWEVTGDRNNVVYVPLEQATQHPVSMMEVRTADDPITMIPAVRRAMLAAAPDLPWIDVRPLRERMAPQYRSWQLGASMFTAFGVVALCLAAVGLYGLLSYMVTQRSHEIGVRKALGAPSSGVVAMVLRGALGMTLTGVVIGMGIAVGAGRLVASQLYGISPRDPAVMLLCAGVLIAVTIVAGFAPARRATKVDPIIALRAE